MVMRCQLNRVRLRIQENFLVCRKGVGNNSVLCVECQRWVHKRCSGISGRLRNNVDFHYRRCLNLGDPD